MPYSIDPIKGGEIVNNYIVTYGKSLMKYERYAKLYCDVRDFLFLYSRGNGSKVQMQNVQIRPFLSRKKRT